ncbi:E3 SUMO-protein ligase ZBED1-like [Saccostrea echinata]|uniref:E3 SUMO-protein ligase ZBED1-like n=1 Tax=Saccostrea echinata TaxID=191078 RepID=UPI002A838FBC|nr:E3 SUMO-protein ligase ZBED1-like [Saccostrea echinata]
MMQRLTEQRRVLTDIMLDDKVTKKEFSLLLLKDHEWELIDQLSNFLKDFAEVTTYMSTETHVSISQIYPIVCGLLRRIDDFSGDMESNNIHRVRETVKDELLRRYKPTSKDTAKSIAMVASFLDPRYKNLKFLSKDQRNITRSEIESLLDDLPLSDTAKSVEPPTKRIRRPSGIEFLTKFSPEKDVNDRENELDIYIGEELESIEDPLSWWRGNENKFPSIAKLARKFLGSPATSVPSERIFSSAGLLVSKLRDRLSSDTVDKIIFLNKNC